MKNRKKIRRLVCAAFFIAMEIIVSLTPLGYVQIGPISTTTMHLPVILSGIIFGPVIGALIGFTFGMISFLRATFTPDFTSFMFSPFIEVGRIHGNFMSLLIAFGPRILLGCGSSILFRFIKCKINRIYIVSLITALVMTLLHTILVMGAIWVIFGNEYATVINIPIEQLAFAIFAVISSNGVMEAILASVIIPFLVKALLPSVKRMGLYEE